MFKKIPSKIRKPQVTLKQLKKEHEKFSNTFTELWEEWIADSKRFYQRNSKASYFFFQESSKLLAERLDNFLQEMKELNLDSDAQNYIDAFKPYQQLLHFKELVNANIKEDKLVSKSMLLDLNDIGPQKPLGYLPIKTIKEIFPEAAEREMFYKKLSQRGLVQKNVMQGNLDCIYFYDEKALNQLLLEKKDVLKGSKFDVSNGDEFIQRIEQYDAPPFTASYDIIADAFGNYGGSGREKLNLAKMFPLLSYELSAQHENQESPSGILNIKKEL